MFQLLLWNAKPRATEDAHAHTSEILLVHKRILQRRLADDVRWLDRMCKGQKHQEVAMEY